MAQRTESAIEVKVGALVLFSLALLGAFVFVLGDFGFDDGDEIYVEYTDITGLKPGAAVKQGGIQIGSVADIEFMNGAKNEETGDPVWARVELEIEEGRLDGITAKSEFFITTEGVLGEKFVSVRTVDPGGAAVEAGHVFRGSDPMRLEEVVQKVSKSLDSFNDLLNRDDLPIGDLLRHIDQLVVHTDEILVENRARLKSILDNVDSFVVNADETLTENRAPLNTLLTEGGELAKDSRVAVKDVRSTLRKVDSVVGKVDKNFGPVIDRVVAVSKSIEKFGETALRIAEDAEPKIAILLDDATVAMGDVKLATGNVAELTQYISDGQGTIGLLIRDEEIFDNLRELLRELKRRPWKIVWKE